MTMQRPLTILIAALGGEGGGVLAEWLVTVAAEAGYPVQSTSIPGVAQRTGATTYYVEIWPEPIASLGGRLPVLSLLPVPGCIDLVVASELLEAVRSVQTGMVSADRTLLVTSVSRTLTTAERMPLGDGRFDSAALLDVARQHSRRLAAFDMEAAARAAGTVVSAVMFGAIAASGALLFARERFEAVIRASGRGAEASLAGFRGAWDVMQAVSTGGASAPAAIAPGSSALPAAQRSSFPFAAFPAATHDILDAGCQRLVDFQDRGYADLYLQRLSAVLSAERHADPGEVNGFALTRETARFLALWMAFDDIVRVADLKCRASRFARVRREVGAGAGDVVHIIDYFKPGLPEVAAMLPAALARHVAAWDRRRKAAGKVPWSLALTIRTDGVAGFLALRTMARLRWLRRRGARFGQEQAGIERWLREIKAAAGLNWQFAHEVALCGRLVKGYGATNERGKENLLHILDEIVAGKTRVGVEQRVVAVRDAREAALADEAGQEFDRALVAHGASPRPVKPQPVVWMRRPTGERATAAARTP
jgi:indolepyruvate ferredoxin oxidoreductase beta subunit